ncbi:HTH araC/xylS-type domain-containing protein [Tenacibaculum sp. 190130A14a]|uniref:AraC family transcriptional regulator, transcriptional activator of pobA n=1 Tax=Tenacibaculum polynesiense TaxID=3137857 RepID=A0ABM9P812_9FLAO
MITIAFDKYKYDRPLAMDFFKIEENNEFLLTEEVHDTDFFEIFFYDEADGYVVLDGEKILLRKGLFLFVSPYQKRSWVVDENKVKGWAVIFEKEFLANFFSDKLFVYRLQYFYNKSVLTTFESEELLSIFNHTIFNEIQNEIINFKSDSRHILRALLYYILIKMNRVFCEKYQLDSETQLNNNAYLFKEALEQNYRHKHKVNDYVSLLNVSRITLNQSVKKQFNVTATEMIKDRIISEVKTQLIHSTKTISEIAYDLNFSEPNNLIRLFKLKVGTPPNQYRLSK